MDTVTLSPANYRIEVGYDDMSGEMPLSWISKIDGEYTDGPVELVKLNCARHMYEYKSLSLWQVCRKALEGSRALRKKLADDYPDISEYCERYDSGVEYAAIELLCEDMDEGMLDQILVSAKSQGVIADYAFQEQSYDRSYYASVLCIVKEEGYGSAESHLQEHRLWASGSTWCAALVCDMVDSEGSAKYKESLASCGGILADSWGIEDYIREHYAEDLISEVALDVDLSTESIPIEVV